mmetsp:Transcript_3433/g.12383  ORF Transcript_3433/g.12383 Transcript_3433/m.12383 type:complete len:92 (+) Transcript_3433:35-310(+)
MYILGFFGLPWMWGVSMYFFWPVVRGKVACEPQLRAYVRRSAAGFMIMSVIALTWCITFMAGGEALFGSFYNDYAISKNEGLSDFFEESGL